MFTFDFKGMDVCLIFVQEFTHKIIDDTGSLVFLRLNEKNSDFKQVSHKLYHEAESIVINSKNDNYFPIALLDLFKKIKEIIIVDKRLNILHSIYWWFLNSDNNLINKYNKIVKKGLLSRSFSKPNISAM